MILTPVIDADYIRYAAGFASEKRSIKVIHTQSGDEFTFKNRTEFYGRGKKRDAGWIGEINKSRDIPYVADEFEILDIQTPEPIDHVLFTVKRMYDGILHFAGTQKHVSFYGEGESFRVEASTLIKYKGNRESTMKPMQIDDITEYMVRKYKMIGCTGLEADDWCIIEGALADRMVVTHDKDALGCGVHVYNPTKPELGVRNCRGFGELWVETNAKGVKSIKGWGRKFFYFQIAYGDDVDNYRANSASDLDWGEQSAYNALANTTNDREAIEALVKVFKYLYPEPKRVYGWREDIITVDWKYVMQEQWTMAHMHRHANGDYVKIDEVFDKLKLEV